MEDRGDPRDPPRAPASGVGSERAADGTPERSVTAQTPPITREQLLVTVAVMAGVAVAALDTTVVATAMPTIVGELEGVQRYGWVFSSYLLTATTTVPLFSKVADVVGRKPVFLFGIALFVAGSVLCGISNSIGQLIVFRAVQGLGAGAVQPIALTIVGDVYEPVQRARIQGFFGSVWGVSAVVGPALGGLLTDTVGWRWVFLVNVPVGAAAAWLLSRHFHERVETERARLDWAGALTLSAGVALLLVAVSEIGARIGWSSPAFLGMLVLAVGMLVAFGRIQRRASAPLVDLELLRRPLVAASLTLQALTGVLLFGLQTYVPPLVQGVHGGTAIAAGAAVASMSVTWPVASAVAGRWLVRVGSRPPILLGGTCLMVGNAMLLPIVHVPALAYAMVAAGIVGVGMGFMTTAIIVTVQASVPWNQRGVATGLVQFSRTIGGAVGVGLLGAVLAASAGPDVNRILDPLQREHVPQGLRASLSAVLGVGLSRIYVLLTIGALVTWAFALLRAPAVLVDGSEQGGPSPGGPPVDSLY